MPEATSTPYGAAAYHSESLPEEFHHGCLGRELPGATEQCWNAGRRIDAQGMEDRGGELARTHRFFDRVGSVLVRGAVVAAARDACSGQEH